MNRSGVGPPTGVMAVGASAGGVEALRALVAALPPDFPLAVLVVLHVPASGGSALPAILDRAGPLPARHAIDGDALRRGEVLVAPPDHHLVVLDGSVALTRGPRENGHRPAVDVLLRTVARSYGSRAVGAVLSGSLDDGAAGAVAIRQREGLLLVQDYGEALYDSMPRAAATAGGVEGVTPVAHMPRVIADWAAAPSPVRPTPDLMETETAMAELDPGAMHDPDRPGTPAGFGCPDCAGGLFEIEEGSLKRYRCRVGHAWSPQSLLAQQGVALESALWMALRSLEEKAALTTDLAGRIKDQGQPHAAARLESNATEAHRAAELVRRLVEQIGGAEDVGADHEDRDLMSEVEPDGAADPGLERLLAHILRERGFDFTGYKRASLARRVQRRMASIGITDYDDYLDHLVVQSDEFTALFNTVLINVTSFFRDSDAWDYLREELVPTLLAAGENRPFRAWSAGCASGEEAYSLAMVLVEAMGIDAFRERVKIYATDVDEDALAQARQASYTAKDLEAVPDHLRETCFEVVGSRHVLSKDLRRAVIFGRNDLVQDAPISHVDVLMCRNTLMYFNAETQAQILNRLHFALRPQGVLFLGKAEMLLSHAAYFRPIEPKRRFFEKNALERTERRSAQALVAPRVPDAARSEAELLQEAALMSGSTAQLVLDVSGRLALTNHRAMHLFGLSERDVGRPIQDLEVSYRPLELRTHLVEATAQRRAVWARGVELVRGTADPLLLDVQVIPLHDDTGRDIGTTVLFTDVTRYQSLQDELLYATRQLETAYEELQSSSEELETTNEELQSTVEELETTNEELQSTNEELETMNEELQSMNDELQGSNGALRDHQEEVDRLNRFMSSVLGSMNAGVAVVDADMRVLAWNARAEDLWGLRSGEAVGEHLMNLDIGLPVERLRQAVRSQLTDPGAAPHTLELDAVNRRGRSVLVRVTLTQIAGDGSSLAAAMLVMDDAGPEAHPDGRGDGRADGQLHR